MSTEYEGFVEEMDGEDIEDIWTFDTFQEARVNCSENDCIGLRKLKSRFQMGCETLDTISYAYFENGVLTETFEDGKKVPKKYLSETK